MKLVASRLVAVGAIGAVHATARGSKAYPLRAHAGKGMPMEDASVKAAVAHLQKIAFCYLDATSPITSVDAAMKCLESIGGPSEDGTWIAVAARAILRGVWAAGMNEMADILIHHTGYWHDGLCLECGEERGSQDVFCEACLANGVSPELGPKI